MQKTRTVSLNGRDWKVTTLRTAHGSKTNKWTDRIRGGSTRVRTHGGAAGSRGTSTSTRNSALADL